MSDVQAFVTDLAKRAGHTYWQALGGALSVEWGASGLNVQSLHDLTDMSTWSKLGVALGGAAVAAFSSTVKSLWVNRKSRQEIVAVVEAVVPDAGAVIQAADLIAQGA